MSIGGLNSKRPAYLSRLVSELKRRNVYKVAIAYRVGAWLVIQAASYLFPIIQNALNESRFGIASEGRRQLTSTLRHG